MLPVAAPDDTRAPGLADPGRAGGSKPRPLHPRCAARHLSLRQNAVRISNHECESRGHAKTVQRLTIRAVAGALLRCRSAPSTCRHPRLIGDDPSQFVRSRRRGRHRHRVRRFTAARDTEQRQKNDPASHCGFFASAALACSTITSTSSSSFFASYRIPSFITYLIPPTRSTAPVVSFT